MHVFGYLIDVHRLSANRRQRVEWKSELTSYKQAGLLQLALVEFEQPLG